MRTVKIGLITLAFLTAISVTPELSVQSSAKPLSPRALVVNLYRQHDRKHSPFFQKKSRALVNKYFAKPLADLIWKDATTTRGDEVGALDGDPLYDAQDMEIKNFVIGQPAYEKNNARVNVTFENFGQKKSFMFLLLKGPAGWRISNIEYGEGRSLVGYLTASGE
jgi:uncharacterized protein DUF3828